MKTPISLSLNPSRLLLSLAAVAIAVASMTSSAMADKRPQEDALTLEMFAAMDAGQVDVKIIPQDATKANIIIKNLTEQPVHLQLPDAFASVPVLAQGMMGGGMGGGGMGGGGMGGGGMGGGGQAGGGGMGGMGGGGMGGGGMGGMGGGMMRVAPEKTMKFAVKTVCLEHGKKDPNPKMPYKIVPIEEFTDKADVRVLCESLGYNQVSQNAAQAVAWHLMDGMSWQKLAAKNRVESKYTGNVAWFSPAEMRTAQMVASRVIQVARERAEADSSSSSSAVSDSESSEGYDSNS
ncbi:hypothetical protein LF1_18940 [Rubripirellula obstinata]|uniref:Secreted protein n=1 Tax=Rubripirellula obstinata TaxID=406547 RepID=A0A5B1CGP7_9BACT|nr:hypothetical protein [Rubripirellula obstinata]KAA1259362.1 hypothetical protein LF1_18940 [Rubripirellula obstinata]